LGLVAEIPIVKLLKVMSRTEELIKIKKIGWGLSTKSGSQGGSLQRPVVASHDP
jgi:hypothetical protein